MYYLLIKLLEKLDNSANKENSKLSTVSSAVSTVSGLTETTMTAGRGILFFVCAVEGVLIGLVSILAFSSTLYYIVYVDW